MKILLNKFLLQSTSASEGKNTLYEMLNQYLIYFSEELDLIALIVVPIAAISLLVRI